MPSPTELQNRLKSIAHLLQRSGEVYALLGLGSAGKELSRMDHYSDLDFFVIAKEGYKQKYIQNLYWLTQCSPEGYSFQNTIDGHKFLYADGVFCEFAVFEPHELLSIPFSEGKVIWAEEQFDVACLKPRNQSGQYQRSDNNQWIIGEALTNLYVGLGRYRRGEKLSAMKFVQSFALDRIVDLFHIRLKPTSEYLDIYMPDRRLENRLPESDALLTSFCQGYSKTPESAIAQLDWLQQHFDINATIAAEIRRLAAGKANL